MVDGCEGYDRVIWEVALFSVQFSEKVALKSVQFKGWENIIISGIYLFFDGFR